MGYTKILALVFIVLLWSCDQSVSKKGELIDFVPKDNDLVFRISNFETLQSDLKNSGFISEFSKTNASNFFKSENTVFNYLKPKSESFLCIKNRNDSVTDYTFISRQDSTLFVTDSIKNRSIETLKFDDISLQRITIDNKTAYSTIKDSVFIASSSQQIIQDILKGKTEKSTDFKKAISIKENNELTAIVNNPQLFIADATALPFASAIAMDISVLPNALTATGVALARDTIPQFLRIFEGQVPQQNDLEQLIPTKALSAVSYTYNDAATLSKNLKKFQKDEAAENTSSILGSVNELGEIFLEEGNAVILKSIDADMTNEALARFISENNTFRETAVYDFNQPDFFHTNLTPLISSTEMKQAFQLDDFFVISENEATTEAIITAYKNNDVLGKSYYFEDASEQLSNASSMLLYTMGNRITKMMAPYFSAETASQIGDISLTNYPSGDASV